MSAEVAALVADLMRERPTGDGDGLWEIVVDLGLDGIGVPEEAGGSGGSLADLAAAVTEFAARGVDLPLAAVAVGSWAAHTGADAEAQAARLAVLRAAAMAGAARGAYELTRDHLRTRQQFGKPLVALPTVAGSLATMRVAVLQAEAAVAGALAAADSKVPGHTAAATSVAERAHQLHGAIGTTREYSLHHLTRMLWALRDVDFPEQAWSAGLGTRALTAGEDQVWNVLTAPAVPGY